MKMANAILLASTVFVISGCSFTGLDASSKFTCAAPEGVSCESMTGIYANMMAQRNGARPSAKGTSVETGSDVSQAKGTLSKAIHSGSPIRTAPEVLRVWIAPWEDADEDLHDQAFIYLPIDSGRWLIEHNKRRIMDTYAPIRKAKGSKDRTEEQATPSAVQSSDGKAVLNMGAAGAEQAKSYINQMLGTATNNEANY